MGRLPGAGRIKHRTYELKRQMLMEKGYVIQDLLRYALDEMIVKGIEDGSISLEELVKTGIDPDECINSYQHPPMKNPYRTLRG